jgi:hypothetical protein
MTQTVEERAEAFRHALEDLTAPEGLSMDEVPEVLARIAQALRELEIETARKAARAVSDLSNYDGTGCNDTAHDDRWCSSCENRNDALDEAEQAIFRAFPPRAPGLREQGVKRQP